MHTHLDLSSRLLPSHYFFFALLQGEKRYYTNGGDLINYHNVTHDDRHEKGRDSQSHLDFRHFNLDIDTTEAFDNAIVQFVLMVQSSSPPWRIPLGNGEPFCLAVVDFGGRIGANFPAIFQSSDHPANAVSRCEMSTGKQELTKSAHKSHHRPNNKVVRCL